MEATCTHLHAAAKRGYFHTGKEKQKHVSFPSRAHNTLSPGYWVMSSQDCVVLYDYIMIETPITKAECYFQLRANGSRLLTTRVFSWTCTLVTNPTVSSSGVR